MIYIYLVFVIFYEYVSVLLKYSKAAFAALFWVAVLKFNSMSLKRGMSVFPLSLSKIKLCKYTQAMMTSGMF